MTAYYNEIDPFAAAWLRELIKAGLIAPGVVDERDIRDVRPDELATFTQCHFFAGIGVWSHALRNAGWPDDRPVWTGSCPCQPFSAAGAGGGFTDERHLWPHFHWLIEQRSPDVVLGEQVASKDGLTWLDLVSSDLEGSGYAVGAVDTCSAGHGAPHIRQRLRFAAKRLDHAAGARHLGALAGAKRTARDEARLCLSGAGRSFGGLADAAKFGRLGRRTSEACAEPGTIKRLDGFCATGGLADAISERGRSGQSGREDAADAREPSEAVGLADPEHAERRALDLDRKDGCDGQDGRRQETHRVLGARSEVRDPSPVNGFWRAADWLYCRDGKWRPVEPGTFPLAHGAAARVGRLRGYGNAVDAEATRIFIEAVLETEADTVRLNPSRMTTDRSLFE